MNVRTKIEGWTNAALNVENAWVSRILANIEPIAQVNSIVYVKYIGPEDKKEAVFEAFKKYTPELNAFVIQFGASFVQASKDLDSVKLTWLETLIEKFQPKGIEFSIK